VTLMRFIRPAVIALGLTNAAMADEVDDLMGKMKLVRAGDLRMLCTTDVATQATLVRLIEVDPDFQHLAARKAQAIFSALTSLQGRGKLTEIIKGRDAGHVASVTLAMRFEDGRLCLNADKISATYFGSVDEATSFAN
jgi:hypothetical protein